MTYLIGIEDLANPTAVLVIVTILYTTATFLLVWESRRLRKVQSDPVVYFGEEEFETSHVTQLFVQNVGQGIAYGVTFSVIKDFKEPVLLGSKNPARLADVPFIKSTLILAPSQKIVFAVVNPKSNPTLSKEAIEVAVRYNNRPSKSIVQQVLAFIGRAAIEQRFLIDFAYQEELRQVRPPPIPDNVKRIAEGVDSIKEEFKSRKDAATEATTNTQFYFQGSTREHK